MAASFPLCAQDAGQTGYPVHGTVVNRSSGQPIGRALVVLEPDFAMLTGSDGSFSFQNVPAGGHALSVRRPGYVSLGSGSGMVQGFQVGRFASHPLPPLNIEVGPDMPSVTVRITPESSIAGQVTLSTSDPAEGIRISVWRRLIENGRPQWQMAGFAMTRTDGSFHLEGLDPGAYMLYTQATTDQTAAAASPRSPVWGFPPVYYPGVSDPAAAGILTLAPGQQAEADFSLVRQQFYPVTVAVRVPTAVQFAGLEVVDAGGRTTGFPVRYDPRTQVAHLSVPNGSWSLLGHSYSRIPLWGQADFQVAGAPASLAISLTPVPHIPVNVTRDFTATGAQASVYGGPGVNLFLAHADSFSQGGGGGYLSPVPGSDNSAWQFTVNQPGRYWVQGSAFPPAYIASITSGGVDLSGTALTVLPGSSPQPIEVTLRNDSGTIGGQLSGQAGSPASGEAPQVWVYAIPLFSTVDVLRETSVQADGAFTLSNLPPGPYRVVACDQPQQIDFHSPDALAAWAGRGQAVTLDPGGSAHVSLDVLHVESAP